MPVTETSRDAYEKVRPYLGVDQQAVYEIISEIGPCHDRRILEALNQKEAATLKPRHQKRTWEINEVTGRRNELVVKGYILCLGRFCGDWHGKRKTYQFHVAMNDLRTPQGYGWAKYEPRQKTKEKRGEILQEAVEKPTKRKEQLALF